METERRYIPIKEMRAVKAEDGSLIIEGYPIVFGTRAEIWPGFFEEIRAGAAAKALARSDEFVLWNHDSSQPMARRSNGTLEAKEDEHGVFIRADVSKTIWGRQGHESVAAGVTDKMSFAFAVAELGEQWTKVKDGEKVSDLRTITELEEIFDYSPVTYPAYRDTEIVARSKDLALRNKPKPETSDGGDPTGEVWETEAREARAKKHGG